MLETIRIAPQLISLMKVAAQTAFPEEACGLMIGRCAGLEATVSRLQPSLNLAAGDRRAGFEIDPRVQFSIQRALRGSDEDVIGVYHSHPAGAPEPSARDAAFALQPGFLWGVVGVSPEGETTIGFFAALGAEGGGQAFRRLRLQALI